MQKKPLQIFSVHADDQNWRFTRHHDVVAAIDHLDAARKAFVLLKARTNKPKAGGTATSTTLTTWERRKPPGVFKVWRFMTPEEFQENIGSAVLDDGNDEDSKDSYDVISDMLLIDCKEIRL